MCALNSKKKVKTRNTVQATGERPFQGIRHWRIGVLAFGLAGSVYAQSVAPDMGGASVEDLQHGMNPRQVSATPTGGVHIAAPAEAQGSAVPDDGVRVSIAGFSVTGATRFDQATLLGAAHAVPGDYTFAQLAAFAERITAYYRDRGYLVARAVVPEQTAAERIVEIRVTEGLLTPHAIVKAPVAADTRLQQVYRDAVCTDQGHACSGTVATQNGLDRVVLLARQTTGMNVSGTLEAGAEPGTTQLTLDAQPVPRFQGEVSLDNSGLSNTGRYHFQGHVIGNSLLAMGDTLDVVAGLSDIPRGYRFYQVDYSAPVSATGWRLGVNLAQSDYSLGDEFAALQARGVAQTVALYARYPLLLSSSASTDLTLSLRGGHLRDTNLAYTDPRLFWQTAVDLSGRVEDSLVAGRAAVTLWGARIDHGGVRIIDANQQATDNETLHTAGAFDRLSAHASREQAIAGPFSVYASVSGMTGNKNLDPYFKFSLGGPYAVRAYPGGEASGDEGAIGTVEVRYGLPSVTLFTHTLSSRVAAFYDRGWVMVSKAPAAGTQGSNANLRAGAGIELDLADSKGLGLRLFWARAVGTGRSLSDGARGRVGFLLNAVF